MRCLLVGNFGVGNLGDEALREFFLQEFSDVEWTVVSATPKVGEVSRLPSGPTSLLSLRWIKTLKAYRNSDAVVFGGGSLFTDIEMVRGCFLWWLHAAIAHMLGKKVHFAFQGIGPFTSRLGERFARSALGGGESVSVRDPLSYERVKSWGLEQKCVQSFDPVFSQMDKKSIHTSSQNILTLIPRRNSSVKFTEASQKAYESRTWDAVRIVSMQPDDVAESKFVGQLSSTFGAETRTVDTLADLTSALADSGLVVSERYHGALAARALEIPLEIVSQRDGDKLDVLRDLSHFGDAEVQRGVEVLRQALHIE